MKQSVFDEMLKEQIRIGKEEEKENNKEDIENDVSGEKKPEVSFGGNDTGSKAEGLLGGVTGSVMTGAAGSVAELFKNRAGNMKNIQNNAADIAEQPEQELFLYTGKNINLVINDEVLDIKDIEMNIKKEFSRHDELFMKFTIKTEEVSKYYSYVFSFDNVLGIELTNNENSFKRIFHTFNIENIDVEESRGERSVVIIKTPSATYEMDKIKNFRSFQNMGLTYREVVGKFEEKYPKLTFFMGKELDQTLKKIYIQYNETDWDFLGRMARYLNIPLVSHLNSLIIGNEINLMEENAELSGAIYGKCREGENIIFKVRDSTQAVNAGQRMKIILPNQGINGEDGEDVRIVSKARVRMSGKYVMTDYELVQENYIFTPVLNNELEGKSIEATVIDVVSEDGIAKMRIDLSAGLLKAADNEKSESYADEYKGSFNFPYGTGFSSSNTGFFCTPEAGDRVVLTFPSRNEGHGYVLQGAVNSQGNDRFNNPNVRNYTLGGDDSAGGKPMFDFQLNSKIFNVDVTDSINMNAKNRISSISENEMRISGKNTVSILSSEEMTFVSNNLKELVSSNKTIQVNNSSEIISGIKNIMSSDCNIGSSGIMSISGAGDVIVNKG